ncbi:hypothetical protein llap_13895 [Limosa lapponica baueri]|uniref:Uncharacterized protein n=1 Tax=Limosa lapponica baueri TaxID=1758121 RepID=A0A2I0TPR3_LIMLA|nr:hypothetical protein llap_13895 [Limosa lapponica baueri]
MLCMTTFSPSDDGHLLLLQSSLSLALVAMVSQRSMNCQSSKGEKEISVVMDNVIEILYEICANKSTECSLRKKAEFGKQTNDFTFEKEDSFNLKVFGKVIKHSGSSE